MSSMTWIAGQSVSKDRGDVDSSLSSEENFSLLVESIERGFPRSRADGVMDAVLDNLSGLSKTSRPFER